MTDGIQLDLLEHINNLKEAETNKNIGMTQAINHADLLFTNWSSRAYALLETYIQRHRGERFLAEDVRIWAASHGLTEPPHNRAWGGVIARAAKTGVITFLGYEKTKNPKAHRTPAALWGAY